MYCSSCGKKQPKQAEYCFNCGAQLYYMPSAVEKQKRAETDLILRVFMLFMMIFATLGISQILGVLPDDMFDLFLAYIATEI